MVSGEDWVDVGSTDELARTPLKSCKAGAIPIAISFKDGQFGAVSNICNHVGGPLGEGRLDGDYITCPWHGWKFHRRTGVGEPGIEGRWPWQREPSLMLSRGWSGGKSEH